jgi:predicted flavoprotein YhiN
VFLDVIFSCAASTISCNNVIQKGEAIITKFGLEGNSIYGLSPQIRKQLDTNSKASIFIDFKPSLTLENIHSKIKLSKYRSTTDILKKELKLSTSQIDLLKLYLSKESYLNTESIAQNIKSFIYKYYILHPLTRQFLQLEELI